MKNMHQCILCIGSNYRAETYMGMAEMLLNQRFPSIRWGKTVKTLPEGTTCPTSYLNRAARLDTNWDADTLRHYFKSIEKACGRTSLSKPPRHRLADDRQHRPQARRHAKALCPSGVGRVGRKIEPENIVPSIIASTPKYHCILCHLSLLLWRLKHSFIA